jgi:hypothetical protein
MNKKEIIMKRIFMFMLGGCLSMNVSMAEEVQSLPTHATAAYPSSSAEPTLSQPAEIKPAPRQLSPTQQWLELQRSGKSASAQAQRYSGEVMNKVHSRYLKSFEKPIPEFFEHEMQTAR